MAKISENPWVLMLISLMAALAVSFGQTLQTPAFIADEGSILQLSVLSWWKNIPLIFSRDFLMFTDGQFRPLGYAVLASVHTTVASENILFWHLWLLLFHLLNGVLVFWVVLHLARHLRSAVVATLVFALHPLATVVVNNINYFHYVFGLTFYLGALGCYLSFAQMSRRRFYIVAMVLFILGLFTSKVVFTLPVLLFVYEVFYRRTGIHQAVLRLLPFGAISVLVSPLWLFYRPHPYHYHYIDFPSGAGWNSFFSVVGATGWYLKGLLFGSGIPVILREAVERILRFPHWRFLLWGAIDVGIIAVGGWVLQRRRWLGLGLVFVFIALLPFVTTVWNRVDDYIHWAYLYIPTVGLAFFIGGLVDEVCSSQRRKVRQAALVVFSLLVVLYGVQQVRLNRFSRSAISYWRRVLRLNPDSETASRELGKSYLDQGKAAEAMDFLFSPAIKKVQPSCLVMSRYYCEKGDYLAAAIHLRMSGQKKAGLQYQEQDMAAAQLFYAAGAVDYAEERLGATLMANPYNIAAMEQLIKVWLLKGYPFAAERLASKALKLAPLHPVTMRIDTLLGEYWRRSSTATERQFIHPPAPRWLRYVTQGVSNRRLRQEIIQLSDSYENDPIIQIEAAIYLVMNGQPDRALLKLDFATRQLSSYAYAWAIKCWAAAEAGDYKMAEEAGERALRLNPQSPIVHHVLGFLASTSVPNRRDPDYQRKLEQAIRHYQQAIQLNPQFVAAYNRLGNLLFRQGKIEEAVNYYRLAVRKKPDFAKAHYNLGVALLQKGNIEEAIACLQRALDLRPGYAQAHNNLGVALIHLGKNNEAMQHFQQALQLKPDYSVARKNLVALLIKQRRFGQAIRFLEERLSQAPDNIELTLDLARLLSTCPESKLRNGTRAVHLAQRACQATQNRDPMALDVLAAAYAEIGHFQKAIQIGEQAFELAISSGRANLAKQIEAHLKLYKTRQTIHGEP